MIGIRNRLEIASATMVALALGFATPAAAQDDILTASPTINWSIDYAQNACVLRRDFTTEHGLLAFQIEKASLDARAEVLLYSNVIGDGEGDLSLSLAHLEGYEQLEVAETSRLGRSFTGVMASVLIDRDKLAQISPATGVLAVGAFETPVLLETGDLASPLDALQMCVDDLLAGWGLDVDVARTSVEPVKRRNFDKWARNMIRRAPQRALPRSGSIAFDVHIVVGIEGKPTSCIHEAPEEFSELGEYSCEAILEQAEYESAKDGNGNPVPAMDSMEIVYYR